PDHPHPIQQHQSLAGRHPSWRQRQAPPALPAGVVLPVQSPQPARRSGSLSDPARCRVRHHYLRPAHGRRHAGRCRPRPPTSRYSWATCFSRIGILQQLQYGQAQVNFTGKIVLPRSWEFPGDFKIDNTSNNFDLSVRFYGDTNWISWKDIPMTKRIFLYSESDLTDDELLQLAAEGVALGH